ncbi:MAG: T9SS type A sorting domain-containing protein [Muribaculaceae bacterium]|nr:T9SS type A sorting domain-containing protein [Muribaculaceae bacterium]
MRKFFLISLLLALIPNLAGAQDLSNVVFSPEGNIRMIPGALTKDGNPVLYVLHWDDDDRESISILDDDFQVVKKFSIPASHDVMEAINFISGEIGTMEAESDSPIEGGNLLVKDIFGEGYNYMCYPDDANRIHIYDSNNKEISHIDFPKGYTFRDNNEDFRDDEDCAFLTLGKNLYFVIGNLFKIGSEDEDEAVTAFYRIDGFNSNVSLVSIAPSAKIGPRAPRKGEKVTVSVDSDLIATDCMIQVVSASGQTVYDAKIPAGQSQLEISTTGLSKGVYVVTVSAEGVSKEAAKIIIR